MAVDQRQSRSRLRIPLKFNRLFAGRFVHCFIRHHYLPSEEFFATAHNGLVNRFDIFYPLSAVKDLPRLYPLWVTARIQCGARKVFRKPSSHNADYVKVIAENALL